MTDQYEALEGLALAATPGEWTAFPFYYETGDGAEKRLVGTGPFDTVAEVRMGHDDIAGSVEANAAYIAAANPQTILKLIAENRVYREALEAIADGPWPDGIDNPEDHARWDEQVARQALTQGAAHPEQEGSVS